MALLPVSPSLPAQIFDWAKKLGGHIGKIDFKLVPEMPTATEGTYISSSSLRTGRRHRRQEVRPLVLQP